MDAQEVKQYYRELENDFGDLPFSRRDRISAIISKIAAAEEACAFQAGIQTGARLMLELLEM